MPARIATRHHAIVLVPATLFSVVVSGPWVGATAPTTEPMSHAASLPAPSVPTKALVAPASVARRGVVVPGDKLAFGGAIASASVTGIPDAALSAYQRAETVINAADRSCNISWQLIAAVGRVESDHGRANGNSLDDEGLATPGIFGIPLDGSNNTAVIRDTDAGQYDSDSRWDRAVGPMQFIPSTWSVVGVDGDGDGQRDPQDIDDAALATAVYLCSGDDDLATDAGRRAAVFRYNHSQDYVDLVLSFMDAYLEGDWASVATMSTSYAGYFVPSRALRLEPVKTSHHAGFARRADDRQAEVVDRDDAGDRTPGTATDSARPRTGAHARAHTGAHARAHPGAGARAHPGAGAGAHGGAHARARAHPGARAPARARAHTGARARRHPDRGGGDRGVPPRAQRLPRRLRRPGVAGSARRLHPLHGGPGVPPVISAVVSAATGLPRWPSRSGSRRRRRGGSR